MQENCSWRGNLMTSGMVMSTLIKQWPMQCEMLLWTTAGRSKST